MLMLDANASETRINKMVVWVVNGLIFLFILLIY